MVTALRLAIRLGLRAALALALSVVGLLLWATAIEPNLLLVRNVTVSTPAWRGPPLRVALLADLHIGSPWNGLDHLQRVVDTTNAQHPDLVVLLGDFDINAIYGGEKIDEPLWVPVLAQLEAPLGAYAVLGNHDWWNDHDDIRAHLAQNGIELLENRSVVLGDGERRFVLAGIGDSMTGHARVSKALAGRSAGDDVIAITHGPDVFEGLDARADVLFAGHTHGGQIWLPFYGSPGWTGPYRKGLFPRGEQRLFVTTGIGMSVLPMRFGCPPEIVIATVSG
jgi:predicted MPP superfamily phosphohydrolase